MGDTRETSPLRIASDREISSGNQVPQQTEVSIRPVRAQASAFMGGSYGILIFLFFCILVCEPDKKSHHFLRVMFECCSAWGTVGLSMAKTPWSLSGDLYPVSKICIMVVMFMGRLRGLPDSIDPSVSFLSASDFKPKDLEDLER